MTTIVLDEIDEPNVWELIRWMAERSPNWVLIGGLMVATFDIEHNQTWRETHDVDSLFDVRHAPKGAIRAHVDELRSTGFEFVGSQQGLGHRLTRANLVLDILSADHFPADPLVSLSPRLETFQTPGGSQAIKRRQDVEVSFNGKHFMLPRPSLLGAIILKASVSRSAGRPKDHRDLAHLVAGLDDPVAERKRLTTGERRLLAERSKHLLVAAELEQAGRDATAKLKLLSA
jgi:hypothetical protein